IWDVAEGVVKSKINLGVTVSMMTVVHDEVVLVEFSLLNGSHFVHIHKVFCGTSSGEIIRVHIKSGSILKLEKRHTHMVSGIHMAEKDGAGPSKLYTTSMDATIAVRNYICLRI